MGYLQMQVSEKLDRSPDLVRCLQAFSALLSSLTYSASGIEAWLQRFTWNALTDVGFADTFGWHTVAITSQEVELAPSVCGFAATTDPQIGVPWIECNLLVRSEEVAVSLTDWQYRPNVGGALWQVMRHYATFFPNAGVFLTDAIGNGKPWYALQGSTDGDLWAFDLAVIPLSLADAFLQVPSTHEVTKFDNGIGILRLDVWQYPPWSTG